MFLARVGADDPASPAAADLADVVRMALEISPNADRAARALVAPHLERIRAEARETAEIGVGVRVHLRLMAEAGGCGVGVSDEDAVSAFGSDPAAAARSRAATVRRHAAALLETLWAAHDREWDEERTARHSHPRGADRRGGEADFVAEFEHDDDDDARRGGAHVGATIEETSRLVSLLDDALVVVDGGLEALAATTEALSEMIESALDALGPRAWRYPPALAGRVYAQLLRASFDPVDEGAVSDDLDAFRDALLHPEGAAHAMGIRPAAHAALHAWCLARHHRAWIVGEGPLATSPTTARSAGARAFAFAADAEADADEPEEAYALLTAATRALARVEDAERDEREMTRHVGREESLDADVGVAGSNPGLEAESVLVHAATGPVAWWAEGALGDFFQDTSPPAGSLARGPSRAALDPRRGPEMTPDGFEATLALGVAAARARATTAAAIAPDFTGDPRDAGRAAGRAFAVRICRHAVGEAYARLRATAYAVNSDAEIDADSDAKIHADSDAENPRQIGVRDANVGGGMRGAGGRVRGASVVARVVRRRSDGGDRRARGHRGVFHRGSVRVVGRDASVGRLRARRVSGGEGFSVRRRRRRRGSRRRGEGARLHRRTGGRARRRNGNPTVRTPSSGISRRAARVRLGGGTRGRPSPRDAPFRRARDVALGDGRMDG